MSLSDYISIFDTPPIVQSHLPGYRAATATFSQHTVATSIHTYKLISRSQNQTKDYTALPVGPSYKLQTKQCIRPKTQSVVAPISRSDQLLICFLVVGAAAAAAAAAAGDERGSKERKKEEEEEEEEGEEGEEEAKQEILWSGMQSPKAPW
ncbi:hypothetical protein HZH68_016958 [Vespula germanica]|uniref:Uncharacterized protein n=1 Tax=Vespula germanica TaxID=30212 RepID=A0A834MQF2_VESGE|nr:hypothetical protein HZH68_016958 [Vespula germanica]